MMTMYIPLMYETTSLVDTFSDVFQPSFLPFLDNSFSVCTKCMAFVSFLARCVFLLFGPIFYARDGAAKTKIKVQISQRLHNSKIFRVLSGLTIFLCFANLPLATARSSASWHPKMADGTRLAKIVSTAVPLLS